MVSQKLYDWGGSEYGVATTTAGDQITPLMARVSATAYVVVWTIPGSYGLRAQLFDVSGSKIGGEFAIVDHDGYEPAVAQLPGGGFVVAWTGSSGIHFQRFDGAGGAGGAEGLIATTDQGHEPAIAGLAGGGFAITWTDRGTVGFDQNQSQVYGQVFDPAGSPLGSAFTVNTISEQRQEHSSIAALPGGGFAVVWQDASPQGAWTGSGRPDYGTDIAIQIFDASGAKVGPQRVVDDMTPFLAFSVSPDGRVTATEPVVAALADGKLAVVWADYDGFIKTRILAADGTPLTPVVKSGYWVNPVATPGIAALSDGGYAVSWTEEDTGPPDSSATTVRVAVYDSAGVPQGPSFVANQSVEGVQGAPAILGMPGGGFTVTWQDSSAISNGTDIRGQLFVPDTGTITDLDFSSASIAQTAVENIAVGRLSAEGALNGTFSYQILSDSTGALRIEGDQLVVDDIFKFASRAGSSVTVAIRVTDSEGNSFDETLVLPVARPASGTLYVAQDQDLTVPNPDDLSPVQVPDLLTLAGGRYLLTWNGFGDPAWNPFEIVGRLFEADGTPVAPPFVLNTFVDGNELQHDLAALPGGGFVAAWASTFGDGANNIGVRAQIFDVDGNKIGSELVVNTTTQSTQSSPGVTGLAGGGFFIAWTDQSGTALLSTRGEIKGQFFSAAGAKVGGELLINTTTSLPQTSPVVTELASGKILVTWTDNSATGGDTSFSAIRATLLNSDGSVAVPEFLVNTTSLQHQHVPSATALAGGGFVIVWRDTSENPVAETNQFRPADIRGQLYDSNGQRVGAEFLINQDTYGAQAEPLVTAAPDGGFLVTWSSTSRFGGDEALVAVMARSYGADGSPSGNEYIVNQFGDGQQSTPAATFLPSGDIVFAWWDLRTTLDNGTTAREISTRQLDATGRVVNGSDQAEAIIGGAGRDVLNGASGDDSISGNGGGDFLDGGLGADTMTGGLGSDSYVVDNVGDVVVELPGEGTDEIRTAMAVYSISALANVENLTATSNLNHDFRGNGGDNLVTGAGGNDFIRLQDGGVDTVVGAGGNDVFLYGATLTAADSVDGGAGLDQVAIQGDYSAGLTLGAAFVSVESFAILPGSDARFGDTAGNFYSYNLTTLNVNVAPGVLMIIDANRLRVGENFTFNGSAESDGNFFLYGGGGTDNLLGGSNNDTFYFGENLQFGASDHVDGGVSGTDQLGLRGNYTIVFGASQLTSIESIGMVSAQDTRFGALGTSYNYNLTMNDGNVAAGVRMTVDAAPLRPGETLTFDGGAETDGSFRIFGGRGADTIKGSQGNDLITGSLGADALRGGGGNDIFNFRTVEESTSAARDAILDFSSGDLINLSPIDAIAGSPGNDAFTFIGSAAFSNTAGELRAVFDAGNNRWTVQGDVNGDGTADIELVVTSDHPIVGTDFIL